MLRRTLITLSGALALAWMPHASAQAPAWPTKPVRLIVSSGAGSATDIVSRVFSDALQKALGQPFVVENRAGANGIVATETVAKAPNDGYTLLFTYAAAHVVNQSLYDKVPYDADKDFAAIAQIGAGGNYLIVPPSLPVNDLKEFVAYVKARPGQLNYASWGNGSGGHLSMESLIQQAGLKMTHVPYKSSAEANTAVISGQVQAGFSGVAASLPLVQGGKLKAIAMSGPYRSPPTPDVKTMTEQGYPFDLTAWYGMFAPAGTSPAIVNTVNREVVKLLTNPEFVARLKTMGFSEIPIKTPEQFTTTVRQDLKDWGKIVRDGNIKAD